MMIRILGFIAFSAMLMMQSCKHNGSLQSTNQLHHGRIISYAFDEYILDLDKGSKLSVRLSEPNLNVIIYSPMNKRLSNNDTVIIENGGKYALRVLMARSKARRGLALDYNLSIKVDSR